MKSKKTSNGSDYGYGCEFALTLFSQSEWNARRSNIGKGS
jgi:hypothetical protein